MIILQPDLLGTTVEFGELSIHAMSLLTNLHWLAPTTMVSALLGRGCLALGHHFFYASLSGQPVPTGFYSLAGTKIHKQQFNTSVGTAFAFMTNFLLATSISVAYVQIFWCTVKKKKQKPQLGELDWANAGVSYVFSLLYFRLWWKLPILAAAAFFFWYVHLPFIEFL